METLTPSYWGSLLSLIVGLLVVGIAAAFNGPPDYLLQHDEIPLPFFYQTLFLVLIFITRHYLAIAVHLYEGSVWSNGNIPKGPVRRVVFFLLTAVVFLCTFNAASVAGIGVLWALWICMITAFLGSVCGVIIWVLNSTNSSKEKRIPLVSLAFDWIAVLFPVAWIVWNLEQNGPSVLGTTIVVGFVGIYFAHEVISIFTPVIRMQMNKLRAMLG